MVDILSESTQSLIQKPEVLKAARTLLDSEGPRTVTVTIDGKQVKLTRVPSTEPEPEG